SCLFRTLGGLDTIRQTKEACESRETNSQTLNEDRTERSLPFPCAVIRLWPRPPAPLAFRCIQHAPGSLPLPIWSPPARSPIRHLRGLSTARRPTICTEHSGAAQRVQPSARQPKPLKFCGRPRDRKNRERTTPPSG